MGSPPNPRERREERGERREGATWVDLYIKEMPTPKKGWVGCVVNPLERDTFARSICEEELGLGA